MDSDSRAEGDEDVDEEEEGDLRCDEDVNKEEEGDLRLAGLMV